MNQLNNLSNHTTFDAQFLVETTFDVCKQLVLETKEIFHKKYEKHQALQFIYCTHNITLWQ